MTGIPEHSQEPDDVLMVEILFEDRGFIRVPYGVRSNEEDGYHFPTGIWDADTEPYLEMMYQSDRYSGLFFAWDDRNVGVKSVSAYFVSSD